MQLGKQVFAPNEEEVSGEWDIPDARKVGSCKASRHIFNGTANTSHNFNERLIAIVAQENKGSIGGKRFEMPKWNMRPINWT
jgi:hypothetical protein